MVDILKNRPSIFLVFIWIITCILAHEEKVVRIENSEKIYLLINGKSRLIPNNETSLFMGYNPEELPIVQENVMYGYELSDPVESMIRIDSTPDDCMRIHQLKMDTFQDNPHLLMNLTHVGQYWNPSIIPWRDKIFVASRQNGFVTHGIKFTFLDKDYNLLNRLVPSRYLSAPKLCLVCLTTI